jgi:hypothetical protein
MPQLVRFFMVDLIADALVKVGRRTKSVHPLVVRFSLYSQNGR